MSAVSGESEVSVSNRAEGASHSSGWRHRYRYVVLFWLLCLSILNFLDRQFLAILAEPVKRSLSLTDTQLGLLTGLTFALFYTAFGIPLAALADRVSRVRMVAISCVLWSAFTGICGLAGSFAQLALARVGVGIGEAGCNPSSYSIIADYFPPSERGAANSIFALGIPLGVALATATGGLIATRYGWRDAFIALGLIGIVVAPITLVIVREPVRGKFDAQKRFGQARSSALAAIAAYFRSPKLLMISLTAGLSSFVNAGLLSWTPALLIRDKGMTLSQMSIYYSLLLGISMPIGTWVSGYIIDKSATRDPRAYAVLPGLATLLSVPFIVGFALASRWQTALPFLVVPCAFGITSLPAAMTLVQNSVAPYERATAASLLLFILNLVGTGGGPLFVGAISDHLHGLGPAIGLRYGLLALSVVCIPAFIGQLVAAHLIRADANAIASA